MSVFGSTAVVRYHDVATSMHKCPVGTIAHPADYPAVASKDQWFKQLQQISNILLNLGSVCNIHCMYCLT